MEIIIFALAMVLVAGFINGSFATPMKYMTRWNEENIWFVFSFFGFLILPWITLFVMVPDAWHILTDIPNHIMFAILLGGFLFGLGQIAFVLAFGYIGIGLAFVINISMGTSGSALIPLLWHKTLIGTPYSYFQFAGILIFVFAVIFGAIAGAARDKSTNKVGPSSSKVKEIKPGMLILGIILAISAGVGSVAQGITYIWSNPSVSEFAEQSYGASELGASVIAWVLIFSAAWIPYVIYFFVLSVKRKSFSKIVSAGSFKYWFWIVLMAVGFWGSLIFFSAASNEIGGDLAPTIAWPLFMVFIILTSNFWSVKSGEWTGAGKKAKTNLAISIVLFVVAIVVFSFSSSIEPKQTEVHHMHIKHNAHTYHK